MLKRKYYEAYQKRYKKIHKKFGKSWAGDLPTYELKTWFEKYQIKKDSPILELGCGEGQNAIYLASLGYNIYASDISSEAIKWAKEQAYKQNYCNVNFFVLDVLNNNYNEKHSAIYSISVLHMLVVDEDRKKFLDFIYDHLTDDGIAIISIMGDGKFEQNKSVLKDAFKLAERPFEDKTVKVATTSCRIVNWDKFENELENSKLKIKEKFVSNKVSGFENSMVVVVSK